MLEFRNEEQQTQEKGVFLCLVLMKNNQTHKNCNCIEGFDLMHRGEESTIPEDLQRFYMLSLCCTPSSQSGPAAVSLQGRKKGADLSAFLVCFCRK